MTTTKGKILRQFSDACGRSGEDSSFRICGVIGLQLDESKYVNDYDLVLLLNRFEIANEKCIISGVLHGEVNGRPFEKTFESFYDAQDYSHRKTLADSPVFGAILVVWTAFAQKSPEHKMRDVLASGEFSITGTLENALNDFVGAPQSESSNVWRRAKLLAIFVFMVAWVAAFWLNILRSSNPSGNLFNDGEGPITKWVMLPLISALFALPSGLGGFFVGVISIRAEQLECEVAGQNLMRLVGAKTVGGFRAISAFGIFVGLGLTLFLLLWTWSYI